MELLDLTTLEVILGLVLSAKLLAMAVVNLTDTPVDDAIVGKLYTVIEAVAGVITTKAKTLPGETATLGGIPHTDIDEGDVYISPYVVPFDKPLEELKTED